MTDTSLPPAGLIVYDQALKDFFTMKVYPDTENPSLYETLVPVTGPPVLNLGTQEVLNSLEPVESNRQNQIVKLPALAITQLDWTFDLKRWTKAYFRKLGWTEEGSKVIQSPQLVPMDILYQLDCWTKYRTTMNQIVRNITLKFGDREVWLPVDLQGVWGVQHVALTYAYPGPVNMTEHEPKDKDRTVRMVFSFSLHAWVIPDAMMLPAIRAVIKQIYYAEHSTTNYPRLSDLPPYPEWLFAGNLPIEDTLQEEQNP